MFDGPITNDAQHAEAMARVDALWNAAPGTPEAKELDRLADRIHDYESASAQGLLPPVPPGVLIEAKRRELDVSQRELARRLGWTSGRMSEIIHGKRELTLRMVRDLVERLGFDANTLLQGQLPAGMVHVRGDVAALLDHLARRDGVSAELVVARALQCYDYATVVPHAPPGNWFAVVQEIPVAKRQSETITLRRTMASA